MHPGVAPTTPASTHGCQQGASMGDPRSKGVPQMPPAVGRGDAAPSVPSGLWFFFLGGGPQQSCPHGVTHVPGLGLLSPLGTGTCRMFSTAAPGTKIPYRGWGDTRGAPLGDTGAPAACQPHGVWHWEHWERWRSTGMLRRWGTGSTGGCGGAEGTGSTGILGALWALKALGALVYWVYWEYWGGAGVSRSTGGTGSTGITGSGGVWRYWAMGILG